MGFDKCGLSCLFVVCDSMWRSPPATGVDFYRDRNARLLDIKARMQAAMDREGGSLDTLMTPSSPAGLNRIEKMRYFRETIRRGKGGMAGFFEDDDYQGSSGDRDERLGRRKFGRDSDRGYDFRVENGSLRSNMDHISESDTSDEDADGSFYHRTESFYTLDKPARSDNSGPPKSDGTDDEFYSGARMEREVREEENFYPTRADREDDDVEFYGRASPGREEGNRHGSRDQKQKKEKEEEN